MSRAVLRGTEAARDADAADIGPVLSNAPGEPSPLPIMNGFVTDDISAFTGPNAPAGRWRIPSDHLPGSTYQVVYAARARCASTRTG